MNALGFLLHRAGPRLLEEAREEKVTIVPHEHSDWGQDDTGTAPCGVAGRAPSPVRREQCERSGCRKKMTTTQSFEGNQGFFRGRW